jgi:hypothetical protein
VASNVTLAGILDIGFSSTPSVGQQFTLLNYGGVLTGAFDAFDDLVNSPAGVNTVKLSLNYGAGSGSAIVVTVDSISSPSVPGDFNGDGSVNATDLTTWKNNFPIAAGATTLQGDADADADVDGADFLIWQRNFTGSGVTAVPEPASSVFIAASALALLGRRRFGA